jgi:hypothetical protein
VKWQVVDKFGNPCYNISAPVNVQISFPQGLDTGKSAREEGGRERKREKGRGGEMEKRRV